jgi:hypothetical protein
VAHKDIGEQQRMAGIRRAYGLGVREGLAMTNRFIVAAAAFLLFPLSLACAGSTGPYDGEWKGTATSSGHGCKRTSAVVSITVEGRIVTGQARFDGDASNINGAVTENGAVGATIGFQFLKGQFTGEEFGGTFTFSDCQWEAVLKRTGGGTADRDRTTTTSGMRGR